MSRSQRRRAQDIGVEVPEKPPKRTLVRLTVEKAVAGGAGLGRHEGRVWLVSGALPGDRIEATAVRTHASWVEAKVVSILEPSPDRRPPPCPFQGRCGGCPWMPLEDYAQRFWKRAIVVDAFSRIGGLRDVPVRPTVASPRSLGYRNKVEFAVGRGGDGGRVVGLHVAASATDLVDVDRCLLLDDGANRILATARRFLLDESPQWEPALGDGGEPGRLVLRRSSETAEYLVAMRGPVEAWPAAARFAQALVGGHPEIAGVVRLLAPSRRRGGASVEPLAGRPWILERLAGTPFRVPAGAFFQINTEAAERLAETVLEASGSPASVLELYGGVGAFALALARRGARAEVVDADSDAVACGREAAQEAGLSGVRFTASDVLAFLAGRAGETIPPPELVIADPPRTGLGRGVAAALAAMAPASIVLVSCDPATLARDVRALREGGYAPVEVVPVDLFPQTPHVEAVVRLRRSVSAE